MTKTFEITPAAGAPFITLAAIGIVLVLIIGLFAFIGYSARNAKFEVDEQGLHIKGALYGRFIPKAEIAAGNIKIIDLNTDTDYKPRLRTNGVGLPGYSEGWFKLKNGEKGLLFVTERSRVVYIPTTQGYSVLLSVNNAEEFQQATAIWQ